jgi:RNA polymerase sigma-70 factor (ECF subfamily)
MIGRVAQIGLGDATLAVDKNSTCWDEQFAGLVAGHSRFLFRLTYAVLRNSHDAEDVVQEVFLKLFRAGCWDDVKDDRAYLSRVAWRMALDRRAQRSKTQVSGDSLLDHAAPGETPEQATVQANWSAIVHKLMDALPEDLRLPLVLSANDELKSAEIAQLLGIPEGTVRTRLMKAREVLKEKLARLIGGNHGR